MKDFLKMTAASVLGLVIFSSIASILSIIVLVAMLATSHTTATIEPNSVLEIELNGTIEERAANDDMQSLLLAINSDNTTLALNELLQAIDRASTNDNVRGIYLKMGNLNAAAGTISELRQALSQFKNSGKFVVAYGDAFDNKTYTLATVADRIVMNPQGILALNGLATSSAYFKDALDKLGIEMQVVRVGAFKSAVEPFLEMKMSDANRLQQTRMTQSIWHEMLTKMAEGRGISTQVFDNFANNGDMLESAELTVEKHLIDTLAYRSDMKNEIEKLVGSEYKLISISDLCSQPDLNFATDKIAIVYAVGEIDGVGSGATIDSEEIAETLNNLADDDKVKAVVLRINSLGGSAFGSEQMWHAAEILKTKKPIVVSMGDYATSGGYYMACNANYIVAQPTTLTGSIGIFGVIPNVEGLTKKIGVKYNGVKTNEFADFVDLTRPMTAAERAKMQRHTEQGYELFVKRCADGRGTTPEAIKKIAEGRVWTGSDATTIGLVDQLGGLDVAIEKAAELAEISDYSTVEFPEEKDLLTQLMEDFSGKIEAKIVANYLGENAEFIEQIQCAANRKGLQAIWPYEIRF